MHQSILTTARRPAPPTGMAGDSGANVQGSDLLSSPAVPGKCRASDIMQIYPRGIYYYKEHGYDSRQLPAVQGFYHFTRAVMDEKSLSVLFPVGVCVRGWGGEGGGMRSSGYK